MDMNYINLEKRKQIASLSYVRKPVYHVIKRVMDVVCALIALIVLSPLLLITAMAIFIDDPGPVLFKQIRIGKDNKPFKIFKFRSMKKNAEAMKAELMKQNEDHGANFKMDHDPRVTRVGQLIRKTSIDELPQLVNILKGDMAVIGPRPFIEEEQKHLPSDRLLVKPGLSCYWQIGGKNSLPLPEQIELDRKYIREESVFVDIKIIMKTLLLVVGNNNK